MLSSKKTCRLSTKHWILDFFENWSENFIKLKKKYTYKEICIWWCQKINSKSHGPHVLEQHLHNKKREDLTKSTDVVPVKYPSKVKLELLIALECQNWGQLYVP